MKIGILTFHNANNYGAVLQSFALQEYIKKNISANVEIIDYRCDSIVEQAKVISLKRNIKRILIDLMFVIQNYIKKQKFEVFRKKYLKISNAYSKENIESSNSQYDAFIVGSDQVWNTVCTGDDLTYFLGFVSKYNRKIAYAASFGDTKRVDDVINLLNNLDYVSLRENYGHLLLKRYQTVIDPVFLLSSEQWVTLFDLNNRVCRYDYILVYTVMVPVNLMKVVDEYSEKYNLPVIYINDWIKYNDYKKKRCVSPTDFLRYIFNAKYVFTTSFHAAAFSIIFNKQFKVELTNGVHINERVRNLIDNYGLTRASIEYDGTYEVEWEKINSMIEKDRKRALSFLKKSISK